MSSVRKPDASLTQQIVELNLRQGDVARHAGIDPSTLCLLLGRESRIRPGTRLKIMRAIEASRAERDLIEKSARAWLREQVREGLLPKRPSLDQLRQVARIVRSVAMMAQASDRTNGKVA